MDKKIQKTLFYSVFTLGVILLSVILSAMVFAKDVLCWFADNKKVDGNGMNVSAVASSVKVELRLPDEQGNFNGAWQTIDFVSSVNLAAGVTMPGDFAKFQIRFTNAGSSPVTLSGFGFASPSETEEKPRKVPNNTSFDEYYLSTQFKTAVIAVNDTPVTAPEFVFLRDESNPIPKNTDFVPSVLKDSAVNSMLTINVGASVEFTLQIEFNNKSDVVLNGNITESGNQDIYKHFGKNPDNTVNPNEICRRHFYADFK